MTRTQRTILRVAAVLVFLALAGATYQGVTTALERRRFPRTGGLVDVGGHQLHLSCLGDGSPTVVLEAPAGGMSAAWGRVQPQVARVTRACAYDRAGLGWSESSGGPYDPAAVPGELRTLLDRANVQGPFVVAGHGLGAAFARLFAARYGDDTSALILVDAPNGAAQPEESSALIRFPRAMPWLARTGLLRASGMLSSMAGGLPPPSGGALEAFLNRPDHLSRTAEELSHWEEVTALAADAPVNRGIPIARLDAIGRRRMGFLTTEASAAPVAVAIVDAVQRTREAGRIARGNGTAHAIAHD